MTKIGLLLCCTLTAGAQVTTSQYDNARTGANLHETALTPQNVNSRQFGKVFTFHVDGDIYAQPLYLPGIEIPGKGTHNVVFVATEHNSVYAFDADGKSTDPLWRVNFLTSGASTLSDRDVQCPFIRPEVGITPTPVIDLPSGTLYVLARTKEGGRSVQRLHALAITTGAEKFNGPVEIKASDFETLRELPRAGLLLSNGQVYLTWASSCDVGPYHGWVISYDAHTLAQTAAFNTSPDAEESGIWQGDAAPAADEQGNVFVVTGNGKFDAGSGGRDYGDSVLKLGRNLKVADYFTPHDQDRLNRADEDLGSGGPVLIPTQPGPHPHLMVTGGKGGVLYLLDRDHLGKYHPDDARDGLQAERLHGIFGAPAYWNHHLFILTSNDVLKDFALQNGQLTGPVASGKQTFIDPGATPTVSADGTRNAIVWLLESKGWRSPDRPAVLHAYDAANVSRELYNSDQNPSRDRAGKCLRFAIPTVANGKVYVGAKSEVDVYGLLPSQ